MAPIHRVGPLGLPSPGWSDNWAESEDKWHGEATGFNNPCCHPSIHYCIMTRSQRRVKEMHLDSLAGLMAPHISRSGRTVLGTRPREVVTSAFMASLPVNSSFTKKANALANSFIFPLQLLLFLGSFRRILSFSLYNLSCSLVLSRSLKISPPNPLDLSGEFSHFPSAIALVPHLS
jgi:hypothetical protein